MTYLNSARTPYKILLLFKIDLYFSSEPISHPTILFMVIYFDNECTKYTQINSLFFYYISKIFFFFPRLI